MSLVRRSTDRPEVAYLVVDVDRSLTSMEATLRLTEALHGRLKDHERMIVFQFSGDLTEVFAEHAHCAYYHGNMPEDVKAQQLQLWDTGKCKVLSATTAAAQGIDRPFIKYAVIQDGTYGMISYVQEVGRIGRRGEDSYAFLVRPTKVDKAALRKDRFDPKDKSCSTDLKQYSMQDVQCRRCWILETMDGANLAFTCKEGNCNPCDVCNPASEMALFAKQAIRLSRRMANTSGQTHTAVERSEPKPSATHNRVVDVSAAEQSASSSQLHCTSTHNRGVDVSAAAQSTSSSHPHCAPGPSRIPHAVHRANAARHWQQTRVEKATQLDRFFEIVRGKCPVCFVFSGELQSHTSFKDCSPTGIPSNYHSCKRAFFDFWKRYAYCYLCGCPQERNFNQEEPDCHKEARVWGGDRAACPWKDFIFITIHCLWHLRQRRTEMLQAFGLMSNMKYSAFLIWVAQEDMEQGRFYNGLEVFLWYCHVGLNAQLRKS